MATTQYNHQNEHSARNDSHYWGSATQWTENNKRKEGTEKKTTWNFTNGE